jgi:MYXO-CTERM domain-containing protein
VRSAVWGLVVTWVISSVAATAAAAPPEPSGPHPRLLLDRELRAAWKAAPREEHGPVAAAIGVCREAADGKHDGALYQGANWAKALQACLVAWAATDRPEHSRTAMRFFIALIDDLDKIGDGAGGDTAARRDHGYAIRNLGPYTALAYDWLHDHPAMTPELKARARKRWAAWLDWYEENGYRARRPGSNYQAGYLAAATLIAIAQGSEAGEAGGKLWRYVADELWGKDMAAALANGGILDGGDWPEGWQYGPLAVAQYALTARAARRAGIEIAGVDAWLSAVLRRNIYSLSPGERMHVGQDAEIETPTIEANPLTLDAVVFGDAAPDDRRWARGELQRMKLSQQEYVLYDALAVVGDKPEQAPRTSWPTWYVAAGTGTVFARTRWDARAVWLVAECQHALDVDHRQPKAGNFILSRGKDDAIVDPSPYGSLSSLTSNAPTVMSAHLPDSYQPSQASWSERTSWDWRTQTKSGVIALRCDYSDQYRFQHRASDVPDAIRDLVLVPSADGTDAALVVVDRATTGGDDRPLYLRFRVPGKLALDGDTGTASIAPGGTKLAISGLGRTSGKPEATPSGPIDCFKGDPPRGKCDAARFAVTDYRLRLDGPEPRAVHVISTTGGAPARASAIGGEGWTGVKLGGVRDAVVVWPKQPSAPLTYRAPRGKLLHVILGAADTDGKSAVTAVVAGDECEVSVAAAGGQIPARPTIVTLDEACAIAVDPPAASADPAGTKPPAPPPSAVQPKRSGCCGAQVSPETPLGAAVVVGLLLRRRRGQPRAGGSAGGAAAGA